MSGLTVRQYQPRDEPAVIALWREAFPDGPPWNLRRSGCPEINLQVRATNAAVVRFCERLGSRVEARVSLGKRLVS